MIEIDGSFGEGGGQLFRNAIALSCVLGKPIKITNIRAGRKNPGLSFQHLAACRALAKICNAKMRGDKLGSQTLEFEPQEAEVQNCSIEIGTAGSCMLLLQAVLPVLLSAKKESILEVSGGTHVEAAPTFEYFANVFAPAAFLFGAKFSLTLVRAGFYPKGGGKIILQTFPSQLKGCKIAKTGSEAKYSIICSRLPIEIAKREEDEILKLLAGYRTAGKITQPESSCPGNAITVWKGFVGACAVGKKGVPAEDVAAKACMDFLEQERSGAAVDCHLADQLLIIAALAKGKTEFSTPSFTMHAKTSAWLIRLMTGRNIIFSDGIVRVE
ncbi:MAG: RNA 3'-terminal phosphate cyclase [Candidatus Micrarchaeota archaeon]|nr:RNA 3'-terminal phosphate cyclase [Candidatus Micrarchaeota archaeon]